MNKENQKLINETVKQLNENEQKMHAEESPKVIKTNFARKAIAIDYYWLISTLWCANHGQNAR